MVSSAVATWVWVPMTAETRPSRYQPIAIFSEVASACMSTKITFTSPARASSSSATRNGESALAGMKTCPCRFRTPTGIPEAVACTVKPRPGFPGG